MPHDRRDVKTNFDPFAIRFRDDRRNRYNRFNPAVETPIPRLIPPRSRGRRGDRKPPISFKILCIYVTVYFYGSFLMD